jgi:uncharacterized membrane protein YkvA (DUF1232 family)
VRAASLTGPTRVGSLVTLFMHRAKVMGMRFSIELSDRDLRYFREALIRARSAVRHADEAEIIEAVSDILDEIKNEKPLPDFVEKRLPQLESLIHMLRDEEWSLPKSERETLLATFVYFGDPEDILPDHIPVIGFLDDVIMIELTVRELLHVREAYEDFCQYRKDYDRNSRTKIDSAVRRDRIDRKRQSLHQRMKRRLKKDRKARKATAIW